MNLEVSYNWIKEYLKCRESAEKFARKVSLCGPSVERSYPQAPLFEKMAVGEVLEVGPHPDADKLRLVQTDLGQLGKMQFVCGGTNLSVGMKVAVALVGSSVRWHGKGEPVLLEEAEIRGVKSSGMICGANEIGLEAAFPHEEFEILDLSWCKAKPGTPLAKALNLEDTVFDIEITTNRPDAFSVVGLAREASAILGCDFAWKEPVVPSLPKGSEAKPLTVKVADEKLCTRYQAVVVDGICVGPSPWWLKNRLRLSGIRPINNVVDITNYVMLELGQPMHAFDYGRIAAPKGGSEAGVPRIEIRRAKKGEKMTLLDEREVELPNSALVIADAERPVAVAGVMGGEDSGVTEETKTIVFESATFEPVNVRRTARAINTQSDSSLRFEKGLPEEQTAAALARAVELAQEVACGRVASKPIDVRSVPVKKVKFRFRPAKAEETIGVSIPKPKMVRILKSLGFGVGAKKGRADAASYEVTVPYWRERDIEGERDFAEEIARIYGYHNLPSVIPSGELPVEPDEPMLRMEEGSRQFMRGAGFTELLSYSFVSRDMLEKAGFEPNESPRVSNPLSVDYEFMRPCLIPGLLKAVEENQGLYPEGDLFEVSRVYLKNEGAKLPDEPTFMLALSYGGKDDEARMRRMKGLLDAWCRRLQVAAPELERIPASDAKLWHPGRTVDLSFGGQKLGRLGEIHPVVRERFGLDSAVSAFELNLTGILEAGRTGLKYDPPSPFPAVRRDLAFVLDETVEYDSVELAIRSAGGELLNRVELFDVYRGQNLGEGRRSLALHLEFGREDRTLNAEEADQAVAAITSILGERFKAEIRQ